MNLLEKYMILCHDHHKANFYPYDSYFSHTIIGAVIMDLAFQEVIGIEEGNIIRLKKQQQSDHPIYSEVISLIRDSRRERKIKQWIQRVYQKNWRIKRDAVHVCASRGIIRIEKNYFLGIFPYNKYYLNMQSERRHMVDKLRAVCLRGEKATEEDLALLGLIHASQVYKALAFNKEERRELRKVIKNKVKNDIIAGSVNAAIQEVQAAVIAAVVVSTTVTTTAAHS